MKQQHHVKVRSCIISACASFLYPQGLQKPFPSVRILHCQPLKLVPPVVYATRYTRHNTLSCEAGNICQGAAS